MELTKEELQAANGNKDLAAQLLVRKAVLEEIAKKEYTEEEKRYIEFLKVNAEIDYFLTSEAQKNVVVYDYELLELYKNNAEVLKDKKIEEVSEELKQALYSQKLAEEKSKILNSLIEKYGVNDILKTHFDKEKAEETKEAEPKKEAE